MAAIYKDYLESLAYEPTTPFFAAGLVRRLLGTVTAALGIGGQDVRDYHPNSQRTQLHREGCLRPPERERRVQRIFHDKL